METQTVKLFVRISMGTTDIRLILIIHYILNVSLNLENHTNM